MKIDLGRRFLPLVCLVAFAAVWLTACNQAKSGELKAVQEQINELQSQLAEQETQVDLLMQEYFASLARTDTSSVLLSPNSEGYSLISYDLGLLTAQIHDTKPYASGSRITVRFGNLNSADVRGLKGKIEWVPMGTNGKADLSAAKSKDFESVEPIQAASWGRVTITLDGVPPDKLSYVRLSGLTHTGIQLYLR